MSCFLFWRPCAITILSAVTSLSVHAAQPLTLDEALALAAGRSQQLAANAASVAASRQMAIAAAQLPDPVLKIGIENLPLNGPDRLSLTREFMTMRRIGLSQELPRAEKRQLRSERLEREAQRTQAESTLNLTTIRRDTALAWVDRHYVQQTRELVSRQIQETGLQAQTVEAGFGAGRNSQADVFAARAALLMLEDRFSQIERQDRNAALMLARWVGPAAQRPASGPIPWKDSLIDGAWLDQHLQRHPDLLVLRAQIESAQTEARLADANKHADWSVEAAYSQRGSAYSNMISFGVSVPLQWDQKNRQNREHAAKLSLVEEARARYEERVRALEAELRSLLNDWTNGKSRVARYQGELIPVARQRSEASLTGYRTGKSDLAATLLARRDEVDARIQALTVEMETARAWAQLNFLFPEHNPASQPEQAP